MYIHVHPYNTHIHICVASTVSCPPTAARGKSAIVRCMSAKEPCTYICVYIHTIHIYIYVSRPPCFFCLLQLAVHPQQRPVHPAKSPACMYMYIHTYNTYIYIYLCVALKYRSLLQNIVCFIGLFCKRDPYIQYIYTYMCRVHSVFFVTCRCWYGVATISRLLKILCLFCKRALKKRRYVAKETYNSKEPTDCSHPVQPPLSTVHPA